MSFFKIIDRLVWLGIVTAAIAAVGAAGILALALGVDQARVGLAVSGALVVIIFVLWIAAGRHRPRVPRRPKSAETDEAELTAGDSGWFRRPTKAPAQSPELLWRPLETTAPEAISDTRPMRPVQVKEPPLDPVVDTKPTPAAKPTPVYVVPTPGHGPYDDLFPPPEPGDEDYLEYDQETTAKSLAPDEQPTVPVGPVVPVIEPPGARSEEADQAEQPAESREPEHPEQSDSDSPVPPDDLPA